MVGSEKRDILASHQENRLRQVERPHQIITIQPLHPSRPTGMMGTVAVSTTGGPHVVLTLIAEVLSGETLVTPGGPVDADTASGHEPFHWDSWVAERLAEQPAAAEVELSGTRVPVAQAPVA